MCSYSCNHLSSGARLSGLGKWKHPHGFRKTEISEKFAGGGSLLPGSVYICCVSAYLSVFQSAISGRDYGGVFHSSRGQKRNLLWNEMATPVVVGWNYQVVLLSYILSVFGSWTTLLLIEHACVVEAREQLVAFLGSSVAMGVCAFWSMPVTGLLASEMGSLVHFNIPWAAGSVFVAVVLCGVGIWKIISLTLARRKAGHAQTAVVTLQRLLLSGVWTGSGIASMHYMGVNSMTMEGMAPRFDCTLVALSIVIAIIGASGAFCVFHYSSTTAGHIFAAFVMVRLAQSDRTLF
jgi:NO-binding membrane sensor protein with MHYT domain